MAADILLTSNASHDWSGTGRGLFVDFEVGETPPLEEGRFLGQGGDAIVHETIINNRRLAWKRTWRRRRIDTNLKEEIEILKKLSHQHLVRLIGAYTHKRCLGMLLHPVATCDLETFFEDAEAHWKDGNDHNDRIVRLEQLGYWSRPPHKHKAWPIYTRIGCLVSALSYLHSQSIQIRHKDLKPSNILLTRDGLYLSDFGHATDFSLLSRSATEGGGGTFRYYSPEVAAFEPAGRASDIFSLGCVLLEVLVFDRDGTLQRLRSNLQPSNTAYYENLDKIDEWLPWDEEFDILRHHLCLEVRRMLSERANKRPRADQLLNRLSLCDNMMEDSQDPIFADCCQISYLTERQYQNRIKGLHARIVSLEEDNELMQAEHLLALDSARLAKRLALSEQAEEISSLKQEKQNLAQMVSQQYDLESQVLKTRPLRSDKWKDRFVPRTDAFTAGDGDAYPLSLEQHEKLFSRQWGPREDLITLRQGREQAQFNVFIESCLDSLNRTREKFFPRRSIRVPNTEFDMYFHSAAQVQTLATVIITLVIFILLVLPVLIYKLTAIGRRDSTVDAIGILVVFSLLFSATMTLLTKAQRHELLAATAAYCAVVVVFISNFGNHRGSRENATH